VGREERGRAKGGGRDRDLNSHAFCVSHAFHLQLMLRTQSGSLHRPFAVVARALLLVMHS